MEIVVGPPDDNVVPFTVPLLSDAYRRAGYMDRRDGCRHESTKTIDEKERTITCGKCKAILDPIRCMLEIVDQWRAYHAPRLTAIREYLVAKKAANESFEAWWIRIGRGRSYQRKKDAAREAWIVAAAPDLKAVEALGPKDFPTGSTE